MKNAFLALFVLVGHTLFAQTIKVSPTELAFLQSTTIINFKIDLSKTKMGAFNSINEWKEFRYNEVKLQENEAQANEWKADFEQALKDAQLEFKEDFNAKFQQSAVKLKEGATTVDYTAVLYVDRLDVPEGFGNKPVGFVGKLVFYDKAGKELSTVEILEVKGFPSGGLSMRIKSAFRRAGGHTGEKIYLMYFK